MSIKGLIRELVSEWINRERYEFKFVHPKDRQGYLESLDLLEDIRNGNISCEVCGSNLDVAEIRKIHSKDGRMGFICNNLKCNLDGENPLEGHSDEYLKIYTQIIEEQSSAEIETEEDLREELEDEESNNQSETDDGSSDPEKEIVEAE